MAIKTQGTQVYIIDPGASGGPAILNIECAISVEGLGGSRDQIDITCLEDAARSFEGGLISPSTVTLNLNFDPQNESHVRLHELYEAGTKFDMAIGFSDGTAAPTIGTDGMFDFATSRSYLATNDTYVSDFPLSFAQNAVVTSAVALQLSGLKTIYPKV